MSGATLRSRGGSYSERASIVIGADGLRSVVAQAVRATTYAPHPRLQGTYFTYWDGVPLDRIELYVRPHRVVYGWPTNDGLALIGVNWPAREYQAVGAMSSTVISRPSSTSRRISPSAFAAADAPPAGSEFRSPTTSPILWCGVDAGRRRRLSQGSGNRAGHLGRVSRRRTARRRHRRRPVGPPPTRGGAGRLRAAPQRGRAADV